MPSTGQMRLRQFSLVLREKDPRAAELTIRRNNTRGCFELRGRLPSGQRICKKLRANREVDTVEAALDLLNGKDQNYRVIPGTSLRNAERAACAIADKRKIRNATKDLHFKYIKEVTSWLAERELQLNAHTLMACIQEVPIDSFYRQGRIHAATFLAQAVDIQFVVPTEEKFQRPPTKVKREPLSNEDVIKFCREDLLAVKQEWVRWLYRLTALTGVRMGSCFSMALPKEADVSSQILLSCLKRRKPNSRCMPTLPGLYNELELWKRPSVHPRTEQAASYGYDPDGDLFIPADRIATNEQIDHINTKVRDATGRLRFYLGAEMAAKFSARNLRHAATCRYLLAGVSPFDTATLIQSSARQVELVYASHYKHHVTSLAGEKLLAAQG